MAKIKNKESILSTFERALLLFKKYWFLFLIASLGIGIAVVSFTGNVKLANLLTSILNTRNNLQKQVETIEQLSDKKTTSNSKAIEEHRENVINITSKKQEKIQKVQSEKELEIKKLKKKTSRELAKEMKDLFKT